MNMIFSLVTRKTDKGIEKSKPARQQEKGGKRKKLRTGVAAKRRLNY
jgi:hypothetical protein